MRRASMLSVAVRSIGMVAGLVAMPLYLRYFDEPALLGAWFTILPVLSWLLIFDMGASSSLRNRLSYALANEDVALANVLLKSAYFALGTSSLGVCLLSVALVVLTPWREALLSSHFKPGENSAILIGAVILVVALSASIVLRVITAVLYAELRPVYAGSFQVATNIILVAALALLIRWDTSDAQRFVVLAASFSFAMTFPYVAGMLKHHRGSEWIQLAGVRIQFLVFRGLLLPGLAFFLLQLAYGLVSSSNALLISFLLDASSVVEYTIYSRPFQMLLAVSMFAVAPVWSAVAYAASAKDRKRVYRISSRVRLAGFLGAAAVTLCAPLLPFFVHIWLGDLGPSIKMYMAFAVAAEAGALVLVASISSLANGLDLVWPQVVSLGLALAIKFAVSVLLVGQGASWVAAPMSTVVAVLPFCVILPFLVRRRAKGIPLANEPYGKAPRS